MSKNNSPHVLIVDDVPTNIDLLRDYLTDKNYRISAITSGAKVLDLAQNNKPDIILLDVMMPDLDGYEVCKQLKTNATTRHIPIIFVTAKVSAEDIRKGFAIGASDYITKPAQKEEVLAKVRNQIQLIERHHLAQDMLIETEKLSELGRMVSGIAHEIATPLGSLKMALSTISSSLLSIRSDFDNHTLQAGTLDSFLNTVNEAIGISERNIDNSTHILTSFKLIAVDQCSSRETEIDLREYFDSIIVSLHPVLKNKSHEIELHIPFGIQLTTVPGALSQILTNLINNSILHGFEHMDKGKITITATTKENTLNILYTDNGCGIDEKHLPNIYDEYFTTKPTSGGSGLGMGIIKRLVESELKGSLSLSSKLHQGVTVDITLPSHMD